MMKLTPQCLSYSFHNLKNGSFAVRHVLTNLCARQGWWLHPLQNERFKTKKMEPAGRVWLCTAERCVIGWQDLSHSALLREPVIVIDSVSTSGRILLGRLLWKSQEPEETSRSQLLPRSLRTRCKFSCALFHDITTAPQTRLCCRYNGALHFSHSEKRACSYLLYFINQKRKFYLEDVFPRKQAAQWKSM